MNYDETDVAVTYTHHLFRLRRQNVRSGAMPSELVTIVLQVANDTVALFRSVSLFLLTEASVLIILATDFPPRAIRLHSS